MSSAERPIPVRRILGLFRHYWAMSFVIAVLITASAGASLTTPLLLREVIDDAFPQHKTGLLSLLALGMLAASTIGGALSVVQMTLSATVGQRVIHDLRCRVYSHLQRMSLAFFTRTKTGEIQSRIASDIGSLQGTVTNTISSLVSGVTTVLATVSAMFFLDWRLTCVSLVMLPMLVWVSRRVGRTRRKFSGQRQEQLADMSSTLQESLSVSGFLLGRTLGRSQVLTDEFSAQSNRLVDLMVKSAMAGRWRAWTVQVVLSAMPVAVYWVAGFTSRHGVFLSIGTLVAFTTLQQTLVGPAMSLLQLSISVQSDLALFARVLEYLDLPIDVAEPAEPQPLPHPRGDVTFEGVCFSYEGTAAPTLRDINLSIPAGSSLAVIGETGSGKTTLGYLIPRLYDVDDGRVTIDGIDVRDLSFDTLTDVVGVVSQESYLIHATIADNLRLAKPDATDDELVEVTKAAQIHHRITALPEGYETLVGERGYRFSGGERQRLAIARTMLRNPPVLILDEATSALDTQTEAAVQAALDQLVQGRTTITIAHRLSTIRHADEIIVLKDGTIAERGSHAELLALDGEYTAMLARTEQQQAGAAAA